MKASTNIAGTFFAIVTTNCLIISLVPDIVRSGDTFVESSIKEAIQSVDSAINSTRTNLFGR